MKQAPVVLSPVVAKKPQQQKHLIRDNSTK